jgi:hypothetical protein
MEISSHYGFMAEMQKSKVKADIKKNRLYITLPAAANKAELEKIYTDVRFCVADLKPGFDVITDLSQCTIGHLNGISTLRKIMDYLVIKEVGRVVRIAGDMSIILKQLFGIASRFQCYKAIIVTTPEEAEKELLQPVKPKSLSFQIHQRQIEYLIHQERGTGYLVDISISGCAVREASIALSADTEISMSIPLYQEKDRLSSFTTTAKVVWGEGDRFALQFLDLDDKQETQLYKCLVNEGRLDIV